MPVICNKRGFIEEIKLTDDGIPQTVLYRILQTCFTITPTGDGTGLGLSLSYDIVKSDGVDLFVETIKARLDDPVGWGEGSTFIINLPIA